MTASRGRRDRRPRLDRRVGLVTLRLLPRRGAVDGSRFGAVSTAAGRPVVAHLAGIVLVRPGDRTARRGARAGGPATRPASSASGSWARSGDADGCHGSSCGASLPARPSAPRPAAGAAGRRSIRHRPGDRRCCRRARVPRARQGTAVVASRPAVAPAPAPAAPARRSRRPGSRSGRARSGTRPRSGGPRRRRRPVPRRVPPRRHIARGRRRAPRGWSAAVPAIGGWFGRRPRCVLAVGRPCGLRVVTMVVGLRDRDGGPRRRDRRSDAAPSSGRLAPSPFLEGRADRERAREAVRLLVGERARRRIGPRRSSGGGGPVGRRARPGRLRRRRRGRPGIRPRGLPSFGHRAR